MTENNQTEPVSKRMCEYCKEVTKQVLLYSGNGNKVWQCSKCKKRNSKDDVDENND